MFCAEVIIAAAGEMKSLKIIFLSVVYIRASFPRQHLIYKPLLDHLSKFINNITSKICHEIGVQALVLKLTNLAFRNPIQSQKSIVYIMLVLLH